MDYRPENWMEGSGRTSEERNDLLMLRRTSGLESPYKYVDELVIVQ